MFSSGSGPKALKHLKASSLATEAAIGELFVETVASPEAVTDAVGEIAERLSSLETTNLILLKIVLAFPNHRIRFAGEFAFMIDSSLCF